MLINDKRALAYTQTVSWVRPIEGADNIELIGVLGWTLIAKKGEFKEGDLCVYFEIDSKLPETEWSEFLRPKHFKVKTMKLGKFKVISQGLALPISILDNYNIKATEINIDLTDVLGVKYSVEEDNKRKGGSADKYKLMAQRHPALFKKAPIRWLMKRGWGKRLLFLFFGKKRDVKKSWPAWVKKTDEERIQNIPWILETDEPWYITEKIDGTSTTFTMRGRGLHKKFLICSRNVVFDKPDKKCFYDTNVYTEMAEKYPVEAMLSDLLARDEKLEFVTLQGETYGEGIQKRDYHCKEHCFMAFNLIFGFKNGEVKRVNPQELTLICYDYGIPPVPFLGIQTLPKTVNGVLAFAAGNSELDGDMREGLVFRSEDGEKSFKAVSNEFLLKYHN